MTRKEIVYSKITLSKCKAIKKIWKGKSGQVFDIYFKKYCRIKEISRVRSSLAG